MSLLDVDVDVDVFIPFWFLASAMSISLVFSEGSATSWGPDLSRFWKGDAGIG